MPLVSPKRFFRFHCTTAFRPSMLTLWLAPKGYWLLPSDKPALRASLVRGNARAAINVVQACKPFSGRGTEFNAWGLDVIIQFKVVLGQGGRY